MSVQQFEIMTYLYELGIEIVKLVKKPLNLGLQ